MRLRPHSCASAEKLGYVRVIPGNESDVAVTRVSSPKHSASTAAPAPLKELCPDTYDGNGGVGSSGCQSGSGSVSGLSSSAAWRMAVIGRHKRCPYLHSQHAMPASAIAKFSTANSRAF